MDKRFKTNEDRTRNQIDLKLELEKVFSGLTVEHWLKTFEEAGVPCGPINTIDKVIADPHVQARNMVVNTKDPTAGEFFMAGNPIKVDGYPDPSVRLPAPELDGDREIILAGLKNQK